MIFRALLSGSKACILLSAQADFKKRKKERKKKREKERKERKKEGKKEKKGKKRKEKRKERKEGRKTAEGSVFALNEVTAEDRM